MANDLKAVTIYTDGACSGNPGRGGYGVVLIHADQRKELAGGFRLTTNNRMEIIAAITGLQSLKQRCAVKLYTDSRYVVDSITKGWARGWRVKGWKMPGGGVRPNADLWGVCSNSVRNTTCSLSGYAATRATGKTTGATNWPWRRPGARICW